MSRGEATVVPFNLEKCHTQSSKKITEHLSYSIKYHHIDYSKLWLNTNIRMLRQFLGSKNTKLKKKKNLASNRKM
jgi:fructose/tagatose bisphosphate aldolase